MSNPTKKTILECRDVVKELFIYEHKTVSLREAFIRLIRREPLQVRSAYFAVQQFNLEILQGESVALIGRNGAGKSTLLRLIAGIYSPTTGSIMRHGRHTAVIELGAGFHPDLTGYENAKLYGTILGLQDHEFNTKYPEIKDFADLGEFIDLPVKYFSSGMRARLAFSVAVCIDKDILLLDEVLAVGDEQFREKCLQELQRFLKEGGTMLVASHDMDQLRKICTRGDWVDHGSIQAYGELEEVITAYHRRYFPG